VKGEELSDAVFAHDEVPSIATVATAVGGDIARLPAPDLRFVGEEVRGAAAVDARDHLGQLHTRTVTACGVASSG
jgi:hypothetical protein